MPTAQELKAKLEALLTEHEDDLIRDTTKIINFETVSGGTPEQETKYRAQIPLCFAWLKGLAEQMGFVFHQWENKVAEIEWAIPSATKRPVFGIASHIDVVTPVGNWTHGPFSGDVEDGILFGRGIQDDKGPLIQSLYGMYFVKKAGIIPPCDVRIIIGTQEETGDWSDIDYYIKHRGAPDYSFTPDADFPIITGEKGMANLRFEAAWPTVEPDPETQMHFVSLKGGERSNIIPAKAEVVLRFPIENKHAVLKEIVRETTQFTVDNAGANVTLVPNDADSEGAGYYESLITFVGKAAHSSTPQNGYNAAKDALRFFADVETVPTPVRQFVQFLAMASVEDDGSSLGIAADHHFIGKTTAALTLLEIGQSSGWALINVRPTMGQHPQEVLKAGQAAANVFTAATGLPITVSLNKGRGVEAIYLDPEKPGVGEFLGALQSAYATVTGRPAQTVAIGGTTYAKALPNCCAFGPVLQGVDEELAHQADERLAVSSIKRNALIYGLSIALMGQN